MVAVITAPSHVPWMAEGACRDENPDLFFPAGAGETGAAQARRATAICDRCGVEAECLRYALVNHIKHGIWGGRTEEERVAMARRRHRERL